MNAIKKLASQHKPLAIGLAVFGLLVLGMTLSNLYAGMPDPRAPAAELLAIPDASSLRESAPKAPSSGAFADRPLFSSTRRIKVAPPPVEVDAPKEAESPAVTINLEGWALLGIFDSGEIEGGLIRRSDGKRHRVKLGEAIDGWELVSVEPRSIRFTSGDGRSAELDMTLATVAVLPMPQANEGNASGAEGGAQSDNEERPPAEPKEPRKPSFKDYYGGPRTKDD